MVVLVGNLHNIGIVGVLQGSSFSMLLLPVSGKSILSGSEDSSDDASLIPATDCDIVIY